jgi:hypothetical protein
MAIDLFVNFERYSNNATFYRATSQSPYTLTVRLSDQLEPNKNLDAVYYVEYSLNSLPQVQLQANSEGEFILPLTFSTQRPCVCSINVSLTSIDTRSVSKFTMQGKFLSSMPVVDFIAYPSLYVDLYSGTAVNLTSANYLAESRGLFFYGEGHTESINLSSNVTSSSAVQVNWLIGNTLENIVEQKYINSFYPITQISSNNRTAKVSIITQPNSKQSIPINAWATNSDITINGPVIQYDDYTGAPSFYSFFASSITPDRQLVLGNVLKSNISVLPYPNSDTNLLANPFEGETLILPMDYSFRTYLAKIDDSKNFSDVVTEKFVKTEWEVSADVRKDSKMIGWSAGTLPLYGCKAYQFKLAYQTDQDSAASETVLPFYKASYDYPTTITLTVSTTKSLNINLSSDWVSRDTTFVNTVSAVVAAVPSSKIYSPKFFNVKGETVHFAMVNVPPEPYVVLTATLSSDKSKDVMYLTTDNLTGTMVFNVLGNADLIANTRYLNKKTEMIYDTSYVYTDMVEIVKTYDVIPDEQYFKSASTPIVLPYTEQPKISPNEWVTADGVNGITSKIYSVIETLYGYSGIYVKRDKFYGFLMPTPKQLVSQVDGIVNPNVLTWQDVDCTESNTFDEPTWASFEELIPENRWEYETTSDAKVSDPACFQKHCTRWNWKWRTREKSDFNITWKDARCDGPFSKKWKFEKCIIDNTVDCNYVTWQISTDHKQKFIIPNSRSNKLCPIIDADVLINIDKLVLARATEIYILEKNYKGTLVDRMVMADDLFPFQSITGISTTNDEKIVVLDGLLPRVSVYEFINNDIILKEFWGSYGKQTNPVGLNQPTDVHVDKYNSIWIADNGNKCVKKFTLVGKPLLTLTHNLFEAEGALSVCVDALDRLHCLTSKRIVVFDISGNYLFDYLLQEEIVNPKKINTSYNKETIYITYEFGVAKYFRNGVFSHFTLQNVVCLDGSYLQEYNSVMQDKFRNVYITAGDKLLQVQDIQHIVQLKAPIKPELYWNLNDLYVHKEEYVQPWVYLKSFHRLWDNIELLRTSLFYSLDDECKKYTAPVYAKEDLIIGQNEIVTNSVLNRLAEQLWTNLQSLIKYFDPDCKK